MKRKQLITIDEAKPAKGQHTKPCSDCPWSRESLPGWLGGVSVDTWLKEAHGNVDIPCHTLKGAQCAGSAIYRTNVLKRNVADGVLLLPADRTRVFATPMEFKAHHERGPKGSVPTTDEGTQGTPHIPNGESPMPKADVIATNMKTANVKAIAQKKFDAAKASSEKKLAAAVVKGQKEVGKVVESVTKVDAVLADIEKVLNDTDPKLTDAKKLAKIKALTEKGQKICDKHLV